MNIPTNVCIVKLKCIVGACNLNIVVNNQRKHFNNFQMVSTVIPPPLPLHPLLRPQGAAKVIFGYGNPYIFFQCNFLSNRNDQKANTNSLVTLLVI